MKERFLVLEGLQAGTRSVIGKHVYFLCNFFLIYSCVFARTFHSHLGQSLIDVVEIFMELHDL